MTRARLEARDERDEDATRVGKNVAIVVFAAGVVASSGVATADGDVIPSAGTPTETPETTYTPPTPSLPQPTENALDAYEAATRSGGNSKTAKSLVSKGSSGKKSGFDARGKDKRGGPPAGVLAAAPAVLGFGGFAAFKALSGGSSEDDDEEDAPRVKARPPKIEPPKVEPSRAVAPPPSERDEPKMEMPKMEMPKIGVPKMEMPKMEMPRVEMPRVEMPKVEMPKVEMPKVPSVDAGKKRLPPDAKRENFPSRAEIWAAEDAAEAAEEERRAREAAADAEDVEEEDEEEDDEEEDDEEDEYEEEEYEEDEEEEVAEIEGDEDADEDVDADDVEQLRAMARETEKTERAALRTEREIIKAERADARRAAKEARRAERKAKKAERAAARRVTRREAARNRSEDESDTAERKAREKELIKRERERILAQKSELAEEKRAQREAEKAARADARARRQEERRRQDAERRAEREAKLAERRAEREERAAAKALLRKTGTQRVDRNIKKSERSNTQLFKVVPPVARTQRMGESADASDEATLPRNFPTIASLEGLTMEEKLAVADEADAFAERLAKKAEAAEKFASGSVTSVLFFLKPGFVKQAERASEVAELAAVRAQQVRAAAEKKQGGVGGIIAGITALLVIGGGGAAVLLNGDGPSLDVPAPNTIKIQKRSEPSPLASQTQEAPKLRDLEAMEAMEKLNAGEMDATDLYDQMRR